jgi:hypothetical protein
VAAAVLTGLLATGPVAGQAPEKDQFGLSNPTPRSLHRPLSADRPAVSPSPYTVDAGSVQLEMSFFELINDGEDEAYAIAPFNLKLGLTNSLDVQLLFTPYARRDPPDDSANSGVGDLEFRAKWNLWGNDGASTSLAVIPFLRLPTSSDDLGTDEVEGGVLVPFRAKLNPDWTLGVSGGVEFVHDEPSDDHEFEFPHTLAIFYAVDPELTLYGEYVGISTTADNTQYMISVGLGLQYLINNDWALDLGTLIGLEGNAPDFVFRTGMTLRF